MTVTRIDVELETITPVIMDKFNGKDLEKKISELPPVEQAEYRAYRLQNGNLYFPSRWFKGMIKESYYETAPFGKKESEKTRCSSRVNCEPWEIDTGIKEYDIRTLPVPTNTRPIRMDYKSKPSLPAGIRVSLRLITTLDPDELKSKFEYGLANIGIGGDRKNGNGRARIISWRCGVM